MSAKLRIGLKLVGVETFDPQRPGNVQGDELVARSWMKYLLRRDDVQHVEIAGPKQPMSPDLHAVIHFWPGMDPHPTAKNIYYMQNVFPADKFAGGTVGVFRNVQHLYAGFLFTSQPLLEACAPPGGGGVVPFAADPEELFHQPAPQYAHPVAFVGSNIRGPKVNAQYLLPAIPFGLVIYGGPWPEPYARVHRGKLPMPDLPKLYSSCLINLNAHVDDHITYGTINLRIFEVLACEGFLISDDAPAVRAEFDDAVVSTTGHEDLWAKLVRYLADAPERERRRKLGRQMVLNGHTYAHRMEVVAGYLKQLL